jgi:hypothetical protein
MNLIEAMKRLLRGLGIGDNRGRATEAAELEGFSRMIAGTREVEYSCDEVYELLDQFAELVERGEDVSQLMPLVQYHMEMCMDCREEMEALLRILRASPA